jgi:hypothetical protein
VGSHGIIGASTLSTTIALRWMIIKDAQQNSNVLILKQDRLCVLKIAHKFRFFRGAVGYASPRLWVHSYGLPTRVSYDNTTG